LPLRAEPPTANAPLAAGYAGGWFHPVTGYSFPIAARLAALVASVPPEQLFGDELRKMAAAQARQMRFALRLNRMLFGWFPPAQRFRVLERFYRLPAALIQRFYALDLTALDRARIVVGRPPRGMSIRAALGFGRASAAARLSSAERPNTEVRSSSPRSHAHASAKHADTSAEHAHTSSELRLDSPNARSSSELRVSPAPHASAITEGT
jgi:hypothetical protein